MADDASGASLADLMRQAFLDVPFHQSIGLEVLEVGEPGRASMAIPLAPGVLGATGLLHGGAVAVLCDLVCAAAASTATSYDRQTTALVTADIHVRFLGAAKGASVRADAHVVKAGRTLVVVTAEVVDSVGRLVAVADFSASLVPHRAPPEG